MLRTTLLLLILPLLAPTITNAQVCNPTEGFTCEDAYVFCSMDELDGFVCRNPPPPNQAGPVPLCPDGGVPNNMKWMAFVAEKDSTVFRVSGFNCNAVGGQEGIQTGIFTDCTYGTTLACISSCFTGPEILAFRTVPCQTYYLFVDGCNGSDCDFTVELLYGKDPEISLDSFELMSPDTLCLGALLCVEASFSGPCVPEFTWRVDDKILEDSTGPELCLEDVPGGMIQICARAFTGNNERVCQMSAEWVCRDIFIEEDPLERYLGSDTFCFEDRFGLFFTECAMPVRPVPGLNRLCCIRKNAFGCDEEICKDFYIRQKPTEGYELVALCEKEPYTLPNGQVVTECGNYIAYVPGGGPIGCDTTIEVDINIIESRVQLDTNRCLDGKACIKAIIFYRCPIFLPQFSSQWIDRLSGDILAMDTQELCVEEPGEYCFVIQDEFQGTICPPRQHCIKVGQIEPSPPLVNCARVSCPDTIQAMADRKGQHVSSYEWTVSDGKIIGPSDQATIQLDLTGATPGLIDVCSRLVNKCGVSDLQCAYVLLLADTLDADFAVTLTGDSASFLAITPTGNTFEWDFGDGSTGSGREPVHVYAEPGTYTVQMIVTNACAIDTVVKEITVMFTGLLGDRGVSRLDIFPNPTEGLVTLRVADGGGILTGAEYRVRVISLDGRSWYDNRMGGIMLRDGLPIDLSTALGGVCYVLVEGDDQLFGGRVVIVK